MSVWDYKKEEWIPGIEIERREAARKKAQANNQNDDEEAREQDPEDAEAEHFIEMKRKAQEPRERGNFTTLRRWEKVPTALAETMPERKFLADRRPGMPNLRTYEPYLQTIRGYGQGGPSGTATGGGASGYDIDGNPTSSSTFGTGSGNLNGTQDGASTPGKKNIPPRRKKKGGPGRKPKNWKPPTDDSAAAATASGTATGEELVDNANPDPTVAATTTEDGDTLMQDTPAGTGEAADDNNETNPEANMQLDGANDDDKEDGADTGSESDGEGSEEGEIAAPVPGAKTEIPEEIEPAETINEVVMKTENEVETKKEDEAPAKPEDVETKPEIDVLGALEAAIDKEASNDA
jgi:hypothetical protein